MKKVIVNLPEDAIELIKKLAKERNVTSTEVLKQALRKENFFNNVKESDGRILIEEKSGKVKEVFFYR